MSDGRGAATVTVFIPVRHFHDRFLREAVRSVFAQTRADWRLLIVDHPESSHAVRAVLHSELQDPRVRIVAVEGNNLAAAYNTAMRSAETPFMAALMGDDSLEPQAVETLVCAIESSPAVDFFHTGRYFVDAGGQRLSSDYLPDRPETQETFRKYSPVKHLMCWRVERGLACGGLDETLENFGTDDYDFPWTMLDAGAVFRAIPRALYIFRDHREEYRLTTHVPRSVQRNGLRRILAKHGTPAADIRQALRTQARYLRQSLFANTAHRWLRERTGFDPRDGWRESYR